jgi:hypothetical protein
MKTPRGHITPRARGSRGTLRRPRSILLLTFVGALLLGAEPAKADPAPPLVTYLPGGFVGSIKTDPLVDGYLADLETYGIGEARLQMREFLRTGRLKLSRNATTMIPRWVARTAQFNASHTHQVRLAAVFNGRVDRRVDLDNPTTRANMLAGIATVVAMGVDGVHLDLEPYPTTPGLLSLLDEIRAAHGAAVRISIVAPADTARWNAAFIGEVSSRVDELDPLYYDSGSTAVATYTAWVTSSLAFYSTHAATSAQIVPILPSYRRNRWHDPAIESIATATSALADALAAGSRVDGAGIWWWWGFFYGENGRYDPAPDQAAWQGSTRALSFGP